MSIRNQGRVRFSSPVVSDRIHSVCPTCEARPGDRCWRLSSWVPQAGETGGFYTERSNALHPTRKAARPVREEGPQDLRHVLRKEIGRLVMRKVTGNERIQTRRWAASTQRTVFELRARIAELESLSDLAR